jgi:hypothetical protein
MSDAAARVNRAVECLVGGEGRIRDRLRSALEQIHMLDASDFDDADARAQFDWLCAELRLGHRYGSGLTLRATVENLREADAARAAQQLLKLRDTLSGVRGMHGAA